MWMVNFWIHFGEKKTQRRSRKIGGKWKVKEIGGDAFPPSVPSPTWIGTRAVRQSRGAGRTIPQSGGFEKYLTIIHGGRGSSTSRPNIVATKSHARIHFPFPFLHFKFSPGLRDRNRQFPIRSTSSSAPFFFRLPGGRDISLRGDIVQDFLLRKNAPIYTLPSGRVVPRFFNIRRSRAKWDDDSKNYNSRIAIFSTSFSFSKASEYIDAWTTFRSLRIFIWISNIRVRTSHVHETNELQACWEGKSKKEITKNSKNRTHSDYLPLQIFHYSRETNRSWEREKGKKNSRATDQNEKNANTVDGKPQSSVEEREPLKAGHPRRIGDRSFIDRSRNRLGEATLERTRDGRRR